MRSKTFGTHWQWWHQAWAAAVAGEFDECCHHRVGGVADAPATVCHGAAGDEPHCSGVVSADGHGGGSRLRRAHRKVSRTSLACGPTASVGHPVAAGAVPSMPTRRIRRPPDKPLMRAARVASDTGDPAVLSCTARARP